MQEESPIWAQVASEAFRDSTFGMIDVRILESGRRPIFSTKLAAMFFFFSGCQKYRKQPWIEIKDSLRAGVSSMRNTIRQQLDLFF